VLKQYCEDVKKRMKFHPIADRIDAMLRIIRDTGAPK
jgi:hypothetical protein